MVRGGFPKRRLYHAPLVKTSSAVKYGPLFFVLPEKSSVSRRPGWGNCRAVETVENETRVFHRSHGAWKTRQTTAEFPTVPTTSTAG